MQIWSCEMSDGTSEQEVEAIAADWLKAVRQMPGGAAVKMRVFFPAVASGAGNVDFYFVLNATSFTDWGNIWTPTRTFPGREVGRLESGQGHLCRQPVVGSARDRSEVSSPFRQSRIERGPRGLRREPRSAARSPSDSLARDEPGPGSFRNRYSEGVGEACEGARVRCRRCGAATNGTSEGTDRDNRRSPKPQEVDRELLTRSRPSRLLETHPVGALVHLRLNLFAKLEDNNVVGSLKVDRADTG